MSRVAARLATGVSKFRINVRFARCQMPGESGVLIYSSCRAFLGLTK